MRKFFRLVNKDLYGGRKNRILGKIIFFVFFVLCIVVFSLFNFLKNKQLTMTDNLDCFIVFSAPFFLYSVVGSFTRLENYSSNNYIPCLFYISVLLGYIAFSVGYLISLGKFHNSYESKTFRLGIRPEIIKNGYVRIDDLLMLAVITICIVANFSTFISMITNFGNGASYIENAVRSARTAFSGPIALLKSFFILLLPIYPFYRIWRIEKVTVFDIFLFLIVTVYSISSGYRSNLVLIGFSVLALFNYKYKYFKLKQLMPVCIFALLFMIALGHLRARSNISDMITMFSNNGSKLLKLTSSGEFFNPIGTFYNYATAISTGQMTFNFGYTWLADLGVWIPYFIWPDRPRPWPEQYMLDFYPNAAPGTGHAWYVLNDGYMSFGILGVIFEMFIIGTVLGKAYKYFIKRRKNPMYMVMYVILMLFNFEMTRSCFLLTVKNYILQIFLFIAIIVTSNRFKISLLNHKGIV